MLSQALGRAVARSLCGNSVATRAVSPQVHHLVQASQHTQRSFGAGVSEVRQSTRLELESLDPKLFVVVDMKKDEPGALSGLLDVFSKAQINMTNIESRFHVFTRDGPAFHIDLEGSADDTYMQTVLKDVKSIQGVHRVTVMSDREVPWFPMNIRDLDITVDTLDGGSALINEDHPGFNDKEYRARRDHIVKLASGFKHGDKIPRVVYKDHEIQTWRAVYEKLQDCHAQWACKEFLEMFPLLEKFCGYAPDNIPQLADISEFLQQKTGFSLRPISGLLSARDFLNALAFRVFYSTQYIRHHGNPFYTPEPDVCHELLGHVPLFANPAFADFSQEIGLASLAASDEDIARLASVYWFTVEFGLLREGDDIKAFGAGLLSSFGEMEWSCSKTPSLTCREMGSVANLDRPEILPLDPAAAARKEYPITTYQPTYFCAQSLEDAKRKLSCFVDTMSRPFFPQYDPLTQNIRVTKALQRANRISTVGLQTEKQQEYFNKKSL